MSLLAHVQQRQRKFLKGLSLMAFTHAIRALFLRGMTNSGAVQSGERGSPEPGKPWGSRDTQTPGGHQATPSAGAEAPQDMHTLV